MRRRVARLGHEGHRAAATASGRSSRAEERAHAGRADDGRRWGSRTASRAFPTRSSRRTTSCSRCSITTGARSSTSSTRPAFRPTCRLRSSTWSTCSCRRSIRTATSSAACRRCCATRRSGRISGGTSRRRGFHAGQVCNYVGGQVPFAITKAQRIANKDPRPSLEERYGTHDGYVAAVRKAAEQRRVPGLSVRGSDRRLDGREVHDDAAARRHRRLGARSTGRSTATC